MALPTLAGLCGIHHRSKLAGPLQIVPGRQDHIRYLWHKPRWLGVYLLVQCGALGWPLPNSFSYIAVALTHYFLSLRKELCLGHEGSCIMLFIGQRLSFQAAGNCHCSVWPTMLL